MNPEQVHDDWAIKVMESVFSDNVLEHSDCPCSNCLKAKNASLRDKALAYAANKTKGMFPSSPHLDENVIPVMPFARFD